MACSVRALDRAARSVAAVGAWLPSSTLGAASASPYRHRRRRPPDRGKAQCDRQERPRSDRRIRRKCFQRTNEYSGFREARQFRGRSLPRRRGAHGARPGDRAAQATRAARGVKRSAQARHLGLQYHGERPAAVTRNADPRPLQNFAGGGFDPDIVDALAPEPADQRIAAAGAGETVVRRPSSARRRRRLAAFRSRQPQPGGDLRPRRIPRPPPAGLRGNGSCRTKCARRRNRRQRNLPAEPPAPNAGPSGASGAWKRHPPAESFGYLMQRLRRS